MTVDPDLPAAFAIPRLPPQLGAWFDLEIVADVPGPPPLSHDDLGLARWQVWITDLGPEPLQTLVRLQGWPLFPAFDRAELLAIRGRLPYLLVDATTERAAGWHVEHAATLGATFEARAGS